MMPRAPRSAWFISEIRSWIARNHQRRGSRVLAKVEGTAQCAYEDNAIDVPICSSPVHARINRVAENRATIESATIITRRRDQRSTIAPANGPRNTMGSVATRDEVAKTSQSPSEA